MSDMRKDLESLLDAHAERERIAKQRADEQAVADAKAKSFASEVFASFVTPKVNELAEELRERGLSSRAETTTSAEGSIKSILYVPFPGEPVGPAKASITISVPAPQSRATISYWPQIHDLPHSFAVQDLTSKVVHDLLLKWYARVIAIR